MQFDPIRVVSLCLALPVLAQDPTAARVTPEALQIHYATVERELRQSPRPADPQLAAARDRVIDLLHTYRTIADFGRNPEDNGERKPFFVDPEGRRCAVGFLFDHTGAEDLTNAIAVRRNHAWVVELVGDAAVGAWLAEHGITAVEAARIQAPGRGGSGGGPPPINSTRPPPLPVRANLPQWTPDDGTSIPTPTGAPANGANGTPRDTGTAAAVAARSGPMRGMAFDAFAESTWLQWWEWNGASFQMPQPHEIDVEPLPGLQTLARRTFTRRLLLELVSDTNERLRSAAVMALGRMAALTTNAASALDDPSRGVHVATMLGLGGAGTAAGTRALLDLLPTIGTGDLRTVALASLALQADGPLADRVGDAAAAAMTADTTPGTAVAAVLAAAVHPTPALRQRALDVLRSNAASHLRALAAEALGPGADLTAIAALTTALAGRNVDVRRSAALALGRSHHDLALPSLLSGYELEHEALTRAMLLLAIGDQGGGPAQPFLLAELAAGPKPLRGFAALALGLWGRSRGDGTCEPRVRQALEDERNQDQRGAYLLALGMLRAPASVDVLLRELRGSGSSSTRGAAAAALGMGGSPRSLEALAAAARSDSCPWVRGQAISALGCLGPAAAPALLASLHDDADAEVRGTAAFVAGAVADADVVDILLRTAGDPAAPTAVQAGAVLGLGRHYRTREARLPELRFQHNHTLLRGIVGWAMQQDL